MNCSLPPKRFKFENCLLPFELLYRDVYDSDTKDESLLHLKSEIKDVGLSSYRIYNKKDHRFGNLSQKEYDVFINLSDNKNTIIQKTDKGNTVVIIDWENYEKKIWKILSDTNKFLKVTEVLFNPKRKVNKEIRHLLDIGSSIQNCLDSLLDNTYLPKEDYKFLKPIGAKPGIMYGLCKVHKYNSSTNKIPPFRLILSAIGTATYNFAKFFVPILKEFTVKKYTLSDLFSFCKEIKDQDSSLCMVSFDIQSLLINIPLGKTINICVERAFQNKRKVKGLLNATLNNFWRLQLNLIVLYLMIFITNKLTV